MEHGDLFAMTVGVHKKRLSCVNSYDSKLQVSDNYTVIIILHSSLTLNVILVRLF